MKLPFPSIFERTIKRNASLVLKFKTSSLLISLILFLYSLSLFKYFLRDPLSTDPGIQGPLEIVLILLGFLILIMMRKNVILSFSTGILEFLVFCIFCAFSSSNSFFPTLSLSKSVVLALAVFVGILTCRYEGAPAVIKKFYYSMLIVIILGILVSFISSEFPLFRFDDSFRYRIWIFDTHPGVVADYSAILFLFGALIGKKITSASQLFFLLINILCFGRTSMILVAALILMGILITNRKSIYAWLIIPLALIIACVLILILSNVWQPDFLSTFSASTLVQRTLLEISSLNGRLPIWQFTFDLIRSNIFVGFGIEGARSFILDNTIWSSSAHNAFLDMLISAGWVGTIVFLIGYVRLFFGSLKLGIVKGYPFLALFAYLLVTNMIGGVLSPSTTIGFFVLALFSRRLFEVSHENTANPPLYPVLARDEP